jgi:hypothetical protein
MHDQLADAAARVVEPKRRKVRKTVAPPTSNSIVELVAGCYVKAVNRIWGAKVGEYLSAPDARRHLWHACFASGHPSFRWQTAAAATRLYDRLTYAPGKELAARAYGDCPPGLLRCLGRLGAQPRSGYTYRALVQVLQRGGPCAKALVHSTEIPDELIHAFATLPAGMASKRTIGLVMRGQLSAGDLATFGWTVSRIRQLRDPEAYESVLTSTDPMSTVVQLLTDGEFPPPPLARHRPAQAHHLTGAAPTDGGRAAKLPRSTHVADPFRAEGAERNGLLLRVARRPSSGAAVRPGSGCRVVLGAN